MAEPGMIRVRSAYLNENTTLMAFRANAQTWRSRQWNVERLPIRDGMGFNSTVGVRRDRTERETIEQLDRTYRSIITDRNKTMPEKRRDLDRLYIAGNETLRAMSGDGRADFYGGDLARYLAELQNSIERIRRIWR